MRPHAATLDTALRDVTTPGELLASLGRSGLAARLPATLGVDDLLALAGPEPGPPAPRGGATGRATARRQRLRPLRRRLSSVTADELIAVPPDMVEIESTRGGGDPTVDGDNLALVVGAWMDATRSGSMDAVVSLMDDEVVWHGFIPGTVCSGRDQMLGMLSRNPPPRVTRLEAVESGDAVVVCVEGPDFRHPATGEPRSAAFMRISVRAGRIREMRGMATREEALQG